jgi:hypothetical protein
LPLLSKPRRWARILFAQTLVAIGILATIEMSMRAVANLRGSYLSSSERRGRIMQLAYYNPGSVRGVHPYIGWDTRAGEIELDRALAELADGADARFDVFVLGGSVAQGFAQSCGTRFGELLEADPRLVGSNVRVSNFARASFKAPQQLHFLIYLLSLGFEPDLVVAIDGFNEVALARENIAMGSHPAYPWSFMFGSVGRLRLADDRAFEEMALLRDAQRAQESLTQIALDSPCAHSYAVGTLAIGRLHRLREVAGEHMVQLWTALQGVSAADLRGPPLDDTKSPLERCADVWLEQSRSLRAICEGRSIRYVHVLQPTLHDEGSKPLTAEEIASASASQLWIDGAREGYPELRERGKLLRREGEQFFDASQLFADEHEGIYIDCCHYNPRGNERLTESVAQFILTAPTVAE